MTTAATMSSPTEHQLTERQLQAIEDEIKSTQPLTSIRLPIDALIHEYQSSSTFSCSFSDDDNGFLQSAQFLAKKYSHLRRVRGDGNCYYRAFLYALSEGLLRKLAWRPVDAAHGTKNEEFSRLKNKVSNSMEWICRNGYEAMTIDMFHEEMVDLLDFVDALAKDVDSDDPYNNHIDDKNSNNNNDTNNDNHPLEEALTKLHERLNEENATSDYCTWFLRILTASQLKSHPDRYLPFLLADVTDDSSSSDSAAAADCLGNDGTVDLSVFCAREVEPMGKECGMVQVAALAECLGVKVVIEYVDGRVAAGGKDGEGSGNDVVTNYVFGELEEEEGQNNGDGTTISLLYRPGHYDILYKFND